MAEIKSTLDIIMEKAKKFSVTEEEKQGFKRQELEGKIKGLVQKPSTVSWILRDFKSRWLLSRQKKKIWSIRF